MSDILLNHRCLDDIELRRLVFEGKMLLYTTLKSCELLAAHALEVVKEGFDSDTPEIAFRRLSVEQFVAKAEGIKRRFTNGLRAKELLRDYATELGLRPEDYYFDVPRLRIVPNYEYLHAGISYAYRAHRDTWYGGPLYQINQWMPVMPIVPERTMAVYPAYFSRPVANTSKDFDLTHWAKVERPRAAANIENEDRVHPVPTEDFDQTAELRIAGNAGDMMVFSGTHLHATVPNRTDITRFSVDFRLFHVDDVSGRGPLPLPPNIDSAASSDDFGMASCCLLSDFSPYRSAAQ
jgi:hypothetical protein